MQNEVTLVRQEHRYGCLVAAAAMILRITYNDAAALLDADPKVLETGPGFGYFVLDSRLVDAGFAVARKYKVTQPGSKPRPEWPCGPWADLHWCEVMAGGRGAHAVIMLRDGSVLDPNCDHRKRLTDYEAVNFIAAVVPVN